MKSFLIANPKGGSGKSTLAINLAGHLARSGHRAKRHEIGLGEQQRGQRVRHVRVIIRDQDPDLAVDLHRRRP